MNIFIVRFIFDDLFSSLRAFNNSISKAVQSFYKRRSGFLLRFGVMLLILLSVAKVNAATYYSRATGNWNGAVWSTTAGGTAATATITSADNVIIQSGNTITVNLASTCNNLTINSSGALTVNGFNFTVAGTTLVSGTLTHASATGTKTFAAVTISGGTWTNNANETYSITSLTLNGSTINGSATGSSFALSGNLVVNSGTTNTLNGLSLTVNGTSAINGTLSIANSQGTKIFVGAVTIGSTGTLSNTSVNEDLTFRGGLTNNGTLNAGTGIYTFDTNSQALAGTLTIPTVTVTGVTLTNSGSFTVSTLLGGTGSLVNNGTLALSGASGTACSITTLTNNSVLNVTASGSITTALANFTNTATVNLNGSAAITGITNGTNGIVNLTNSGTITSFNNSTSTSTLNISALTVPTITTLTTSTVGNTVNYNGAGAQTVKVNSYSNLILSGSGAKTFAVTTVNNNLTLSGTASATTAANLTVGGALTVGDGTTFSVAGFTLNVTGATTVGGGTSGVFNITSATGTKTFTGDVILNSGSTWNESAAAAVTYGGSLTINASTFTSSTGVHTFSGTSKTISGSLSTTIPSITVSGTYTNSAVLTMSTALAVNGTLSNSSSGVMNCSAPLTGTGTFNNAGSLILGGTCAVNSFSNTGTTTKTGAGATTTALANFVNTGTLNLNGTGTFTGITNSTGGIVNLSSSGTISTFSNATSTSIFNISATTVPTITNLTATVTGNTVDYNGAGAQTINNTTYSYLILQGSGAKTFPTGTTTVNGLLSVEGTATTTVTGTLTYGTSAILQYKGSGSQTTGNEFPATFSGTGGVIINNASGVALGAARIISGGPLTLTSGILSTTTTNLLTISNTLTAAITGQSSSSYISGPLKRNIRASLTGSDSTYVFPVGTSTSYLPFTMVNPTTGTGTVTAQVQATAGSTGGSVDGTLSALGTSEYWTVTTSGNFTNTTLSVSRPTAISPLNALAGATSLTGSYTNLGGTVLTYGVSRTSSIGSTRYFTLASGVTGIYKSVSSISGLTYKENLGPSSSTSFVVSGYSISDNIRVEPLATSGTTYFEVSTDNSTFGSVVTLPVSTGVVVPTTIYARMKSGFTVGSYTGNIQLSSSGQANSLISCSGTVTTGPAVSTSVTTVSGLTYVYSASTSTATTFTVSGTNLADTVKVTAPTGYQLSSDGTNYYTSINLNTAKSATLAASTVYVRLKLGLGVGSYTGNVVVSSTGATSKNIVCSGSVTSSATITLNTSFLGGFLYASGTTTANSKPQKIKFYGTNLSGAVTVTSGNTTYFVVSKTLNGTYSSSVSYSASGTYNDSVYVKMTGGITTAGEYGPYAITFTSSGAVTKSAGCKGKVVAASTASLYSSSTSLTGFGYQYGSGTATGVMYGGPSSPQPVTVSGVSLGTNALTVTLSSTNFEVSLSSGSGYQSSISITPSGGVVAPTVVYVRLKSNLAIGSYTGNLLLSSGSASAVTISLLSAQVYSSPLITATGGGSFCIGSTISLGSSGADISSQYWEGPNSYYSTSANNTLTSSATVGLSGDYIVTGNVIAGGNLLYNGSFEDGNIGFGSNYTYRDSTYNSGSSYGALYNEGEYSVVTIPHNVHTNFTYNGPESGKKQMVINGSPTAGVVIWSQSVSVIPGADYQFTYWEQTAELPNPSQLQLYINGVAAGPVYTASSTKGVWTQYLYNASAGSNSILNLELVNQNTVANGNDFALDDMQFKQVLAAKDTATIAVSSAFPVSVDLVVSQNPVNSGIPVTFTATPTNGGTSPIYTWYKNNVVISGATDSTYTYTPADGDRIRCVLHSSLTCVSGNPAKDSIVMVVNTVAVHNYWMGGTSTTWGTASNWTAGYVPASGDDVEFATTTNYGTAAQRDLTVDQYRTVGNLINATSLSTIIPAGKGLKVNGSVLPYDDTDYNKIIIKASTTSPGGIFIYNNPQTHPVYATVEMYSKATISTVSGVKSYNWQYFGIPLTSLVASPTLDYAYVRKYNENTMHTAADSTRLWQSLSNSSTLLPFYTYEICQTSPKIYTFTGKLNNSDFYASSTNYSASASSPGQLPYTSGAWYAGMTLFANSYTAPIDITHLRFGSQTQTTVYQYITGTLYDWRVNKNSTTDTTELTAGQYIASTQLTAGSLGIPRYVAPMANMLIIANSSSASATFGMKYSEVIQTFYSTLQYAKTTEVDTTLNKCGTKILIKGNSGKDCTWIFTNKGCTDGYDDGWDATKKFGAVTAPQIYLEGTDNLYQISGVSTLNGAQIGFKAGADNEYTMTFTHNNLSTYYQSIYLFDKVENTIVDISQNNSEYSFISSATPYQSSRFELVAKPYEISSDNGTQLSTFAASGTIFLENKSKEQANVIIYDALGKQIKSMTVNANSITHSYIAAKGVYVVKMSTSLEQVSKRLIVR